MEECYICLEEETNENTFFTTEICKCKSLKIHKKCFKELENKYSCSVCKEPFENIYLHYDNEIIHIKKGGFIEKYTINKKNIKNGFYKCYYPNGDIFISCFFINGLRFGMYQMYYLHSILKESCWYNFGMKEGLYISYYINRKIHEKINYNCNQIHGTYEIFDRKGNPIIKATGYNGFLHKKLILYNLDNYRCIEANYDKGLLHGRFQIWDTNKNLEFDGNYKNGEYIGDYISKKSLVYNFFSKMIECFPRKKKNLTSK